MKFTVGRKNKQRISYSSRIFFLKTCLSGGLRLKFVNLKCWTICATTRRKLTNFVVRKWILCKNKKMFLRPTVNFILD